MTNSDLDAKLRKLNDMEKELKESHQVQLKNRFSVGDEKEHWQINSVKLMLPMEEIAIHKHDRFTQFDKHNHDYLEMMFVYSGSITHHFEEEKVVLNKGEILLLDMNVEHSIEMAGEDDIAINVLVKKEFFDTFFMQQIAYNDLISNFVVKAIYGKEDIKQYIYFKTAENDEIWRLMIHLLSEYYEKRNGMVTAIRAYMLLIFNELLRDYQKYLSEQMVYHIDNTIIGEILNYLNQNYKTATLRDMSQAFNYSSDHLGKQIKKLTGKSIKALIKERKLEQAVYLLKHTQLPITEMIAEVGYTNVTYFYKQFREKYGVTPDEYRKYKNKSK